MFSWRDCGFARVRLLLFLTVALLSLRVHAYGTTFIQKLEIKTPTLLNNADPSQQDCNLAAHILRDFTAELRNELTLTQAQKHEMLTQFIVSWGGCYEVTADETLAFMAAYEAEKPPLFAAPHWVNPKDFDPETRVLYLVQQWLFDHAFVPGKLDTVAGIAYEAADVFPGSVKTEAFREDVAVTVSGTYHADPETYPHGRDTVRRITGTYAAPGEIVTVELDPRFVGLGLEVMIGAHQNDLTHRGERFNRFPRIGNRFPLDQVVTRAANPFGGGIYITVPEGSRLGDLDIFLSGVVKAPHFSMCTGSETTLASWHDQRVQSGVSWFDWASDYGLMTLPMSMVRDLDDPTDLLEARQRAVDHFSRLTGRPATHIQAEYLVADRHRVARDIPDSTIFNALGRLHPMAILRDEVESYGSLPAAFGNSEIYEMDLDEAFAQSSRPGFYLDEAAADWMISPNFHRGLTREVDPPSRNALGSQARGHEKWVELAGLFGWDALSEINRVFYRENHEAGHDLQDDALIRTASQVLNTNLAPFFTFWGVLPSETLVDELAALPASLEVRDLLLHYRAVVPGSVVSLLNAHEPKLPHTQNALDHTHFGANPEMFDHGARVVARINHIIRKYYGASSLHSSETVNAATTANAFTAVSKSGFSIVGKGEPTPAASSKKPRSSTRIPFTPPISDPDGSTKPTKGSKGSD